MEEFLKTQLMTKIGNPDYYSFVYKENNNKDALTNDWLKNRTSYIYKVAVMAAIDSNKCDFAHVVIGTQRGENDEPELKGYLYFSDGENDDMGRVLKRAVSLMSIIHPAFDAE